MKHPARSVPSVFKKFSLFAAFALIVIGYAGSLWASDLPLTAASPLTGVAFDDKPLSLPVQRNFQMAMLTAGSELGRSCNRMEAYGWRMSQTEQGRVNQIFNNTVDRLRLMGYTITPQDLSSVSKDITLFTADHDNKHFIFLWSAGELGLVLNLCETAAPLEKLRHPDAHLAPSVQTFPITTDVVPALGRRGARDSGGFSPIGTWVGSYTCAQGYTGGTLEITHLRGQDFDGVFKFYPTLRNLNVPPGSYTVYGQYDSDQRRILINPGKWLQRPANFYNTVIVGAFDPIADSFSAYFQGINGCTSFEAKREGDALSVARLSGDDNVGKRRHTIKKKRKKVIAAKPAAEASPAMPAPAPASPPAPQTMTPPPVAPVVAPPASSLSPPPVASPAVTAPKPIAVPPPAVPPPFAVPADDKGIVLPGSGK